VLQARHELLTKNYTKKLWTCKDLSGNPEQQFCLQRICRLCYLSFKTV